MRIWALAALATLVGCAAEGDDERERTSEVASPLAISSNLWASRTFSIKYLNGFGEYEAHGPDYRAATREAIEETWATESGIAFYGYDDLGPYGDLTIALRKGTQWATSSNIGPSGVTWLWSPTSEPAPWSATLYRPLMARGIGMALGFLPEDARADGPNCGSPVTRPVAQTVGAWDPVSIMNPCSDATSPNRNLSASDIDGVQKIYGSSQPLAVGCFPGGTPFTFARGNDNLLVQNWNNGASWTWTSFVGHPLGGSPTVLTWQNVPHVFVREADGTLGEMFWNGSAWQWVNHGAPIVGGVMGTPAAIIDASGNPHIVIRGADRRLYERVLVSGTFTWRNVGGKVASDPEVVLQSGWVRVFAKGAEPGAPGSLGIWTLPFLSNTWGGGVTDGFGVRSQPRAIVAGNVARVFYRSTTDTLVEVDVTLGNPSVTVTNHGGVVRGTPSVQTALNVFVRGSDDRIWERWYDGTTWNWSSRGSVPMGASPTGTTIDGTRRVFIRRTDGGIDEGVATGVNTWSWVDHGAGGHLP